MSDSVWQLYIRSCSTVLWLTQSLAATAVTPPDPEEPMALKNTRLVVALGYEDGIYLLA